MSNPTDSKVYPSDQHEAEKRTRAPAEKKNTKYQRALDTEFGAWVGTYIYIEISTKIVHISAYSTWKKKNCCKILSSTFSA